MGREGGREGRGKGGRERGGKPPLFWLNLGVGAMACIRNKQMSNNQMKCKLVCVYDEWKEGGREGREKGNGRSGA